MKPKKTSIKPTVAILYVSVIAVLIAIFLYALNSYTQSDLVKGHSGETQIDIYAGGDGSPSMSLLINDQVVKTFTKVKSDYRNRQFNKYTFRVAANLTVDHLKIAFVNDNGPNDLVVDKIIVNGIAYESEDPSTFSTGVWTNGKCQKNGGNFKKEIMHCNGYFKYSGSGTPAASPPAQEIQTVVDIYAAGKGTPTMELLVNDQVTSTWQNVKGDYSNRSFEKYTYTTSQPLQADQLKVAFTNDTLLNDLYVDKIVVNGVTYESEDASTFSTGTWTNGRCQYNGGYFQKETLHCRGYFQYQGSGVATTPPATSTPSPTLTATPITTPISAPPATQLPTPTSSATTGTLAEAGRRHNITMGTAVSWWVVDRKEQDYLSTVLREYDYVVAENVFKPVSISQKEGSFNFGPSDGFLNWAEQNNKIVGAHALVWHHAVPRWMESGNYSNEYVETWLETYIKTVVGRYKGRVKQWDVVNEPVRQIQDSSGKWIAYERTGSYWYRKIGPSYIEKAFRWAHQADPEAKLFINEYGTEWNGAKTDLFYTLVKNLLDKGVPVHAVGFQVHQHVNVKASYEQMYTSMKRFTDLGLEVKITELDVAIPLPVDGNDTKNQVEIYYNITKACRALPKCTGITTWGFTDKYSWINQLNNAGGHSGVNHGSPLPFDDNYHKKPAYYAIMDALK